MDHALPFMQQQYLLAFIVRLYSSEWNSYGLNIPFKQMVMNLASIYDLSRSQLCYVNGNLDVKL